MPYVIGPDSSHKSPVLKRLDHIICRVPDIGRYHDHWTRNLGFPEAWPVGRFWPEGRTSGIFLGGINLELIQPDSDSPDSPVCDTLVFEPTSIEVAEQGLAKAGLQPEALEKWEDDSQLLELRGFAGADAERRQLICRNLFPRGAFPVQFFLCEYSPELRARLTPDATRAPYGKVLSIEVQMESPGQIRRLRELGYVGQLEIIQTEDRFGPFRVTGIKFETGIPDSGGLPLGFRFI